MLGKFKSVKNDIGNLASNIKKEEFLKQLKGPWKAQLKTDNIDKETNKAWERIQRSGPFLLAFMKIGITKEDIKKTITEIIEEREKDA